MKHLTPLFCVLLLVGCSSEKPEDTVPDEQARQSADPQAESSDDVPGDPRAIFARMAKVYQSAKTYGDHGEMRLTFVQQGQQRDERDRFVIAMQRPDKLRIETDESQVLIDGEKLFAAVQAVPGQVVVRSAPQKLTLDTVMRNPIVAQSLGTGLIGSSVRLVLLLDDDPAATLLNDAESVEMAEPGELGGKACHRVRVTRQGGVITYWIDRQSYLLRRVDLPAAGLLQQLQASSATLMIDFPGAEIGVNLAPETFRFEMPKGAERVKFFQPPSPADLLGEPAPEFRFENPGGEAVTNQSVQGKTAVFEFWSTTCAPCRTSLPKLDAVRQRYADQADVVFYAVSLDPSQVSDADVRAALDELDVAMPLLRDPTGESAARFRSTATPSLFVIGPAGRVHHFEIGANPNVTTQLPEVIDAVAAGEAAFEEALAEHRAQLDRYERMIEQAEQDAQTQQPETEIAPRTEPQALKLELAWSLEDLPEPGNILPFTRDGRPRLAVVDSFSRIAELTPGGTVEAIHEFELEEGEAINSLRTALDSSGRRYFAAVAIMMGQQRFHVLDARFQKLLSFPQTALQNPHAGIGDVQLGALRPGGELRALVGYWGDVGVQAVSIEGERLWANRNVAGVQRIALSAPDADGQRELYCTGTTGALAVLNADGDLQTPMSLPGRFIAWIVGADLGPGGERLYCGLAGGEMGRNEAVGLEIENGQIRETWSYRLPDGLHGQPIEPVVAGRLGIEGTAAWLLPGADGSIHILGTDGTVIDRFSYGAALGGLATVVDGQRTLLLIATRGKIEGYTIGR